MFISHSVFSIDNSFVLTRWTCGGQKVYVTRSKSSLLVAMDSHAIVIRKRRSDKTLEIENTMERISRIIGLTLQMR